MRSRIAQLATLAIVPIASTAHAAVWEFDWNAPAPLPGGSVSNSAGTIKAVNGAYDTNNEILTWDVTVAANTTDAISLVLSSGPNPKNNPGQYAQFFYDGNALTVYGYNGKNNSSSWEDGNGDGSDGDADRIASSLVDNSFVMELSKTQSGADRVFHMKLDVSDINAHSPAFPDPDGEPWEGAQFGENLGIWMHTFDRPPKGFGRGTKYDDGWLERWDFKKEGWLDTTNSITTPTPGSIALMGMGGLLLVRRKRNG